MQNTLQLDLPGGLVWLSHIDTMLNAFAINLQAVVQQAPAMFKRMVNWAMNNVPIATQGLPYTITLPEPKNLIQ